MPGSEGGSGGDALAFQAWGPEFEPQTSQLKPSAAGPHAYNPSAVAMETGGFPRLSGQSAWLLREFQTSERHVS